MTFLDHSLPAIPGGPINAILLVLSTIALAIILAKLWHFARMGQQGSRHVAQAMTHLQQCNTKEALLMARNTRTPGLRVITHYVTLTQTSDCPDTAIREESLRFARQEVGTLSKGLRPLEVIANIAPLLGLFGTVLGMIEAFQAMELAGSQVDPSVLSGGIWKALLTTAGGLAVAIPVSMIHSALERKVELETATLQDILDRLFFLQAVPELQSTKECSHIA